MVARRIFEDENVEQPRDPDAHPIRAARLFTQPYDLVITSLMDQVKDGTVQIRQLSGRPEFQRWYVWNDKLASRLIESILLNIPIPPCYLSQDPEFRLDVIDGQQRIFSIYRFMENHFALKDQEILTELNGMQFFQLDAALRRRIETFTLRCVVVMNESDLGIRFEVFERLNTSTMPLNAQELRNSLYGGNLLRLLGNLANGAMWLKIIHRKAPDQRMRDEELILRFFGFYIYGLDGYETPQKDWLNEVANKGRNFSADYIGQLASVWETTLDNCLTVFSPDDCFRRLSTGKRPVVNRALMDLTMNSLADVPPANVRAVSHEFRDRYQRLLLDKEFDELITRGIDHMSRTRRRFELWSERVSAGLF